MWDFLHLHWAEIMTAINSLGLFIIAKSGVNNGLS